MRAAIIKDDGVTLDDSYPDPRPERDEALIKVLLAGVCDTDIQMASGYMRFRGVPGHEFVGEVAEGSRAWLGKRVVGEINCACGVCELCAAGLGKHCPYRTTLGIANRDGCFAEYFLLPTANLHEVPPGIPDAKAVFAEPLAAALNVVERHHVPITNRAAVVGDGKLGLLVAQVLSLTTPDVTVVGHHPGRTEKLALMGRPLPIVSPADAPNRHFDVVVECTGAADGLEQALQYVRPRGLVILKSTLADPHNLTLADAVVNEVTIAGNRCGPFPPALHLLAEGLVDPAPLIEKTHRWEDLPKLLTGGAPGLKHLVQF